MVLTRILGLILGAIAVNFVAVGAWNLYQAFAHG
jgi:multiple antibiotic resistance protein